jgi:hypothetical protein
MELSVEGLTGPTDTWTTDDDIKLKDVITATRIEYIIADSPSWLNENAMLA